MKGRTVALVRVSPLPLVSFSIFPLSANLSAPFEAPSALLRMAASHPGGAVSSGESEEALVSAVFAAAPPLNVQAWSPYPPSSFGALLAPLLRAWLSRLCQFQMLGACDAMELAGAGGGVERSFRNK